jgi:hypothetical protein
LPFGGAAKCERIDRLLEDHASHPARLVLALRLIPARPRKTAQETGQREPKNQYTWSARATASKGLSFWSSVIGTVLRGASASFGLIRSVSADLTTKRAGISAGAVSDSDNELQAQVIAAKASVKQRVIVKTPDLGLEDDGRRRLLRYLSGTRSETANSCA